MTGKYSAIRSATVDGRLPACVPEELPPAVPATSGHEREKWLYNNPEALAAVQEGIRQSAAGETAPFGSFAQYADIDID